MSLQSFDRIIKDNVAKARQATKHPAKLVVLSNLLNKLFGVDLEDLLPRMEKKLYGVRGGADLLFSHVVFEVKVDLDKEMKDAKIKLAKHFQTLHQHEPEKKHIGIATDVIKFKAYLPLIKNGQIVGVSKISSIDISVAPTNKTILWLDSFIFSKSKIRPTADDLKWRFGPGSPTYSIAIDTITPLWSGIEDEGDAKLKLDLWAKNMEIVYGNKPKLDSFMDHTYLVTLVKLIVYLGLSGDNVVKENRIKEALTGEYFSSYGIANLIEEDFFIWVLHPRIISKALEPVCNIAKQLLRYDFSQIDEDFFKEIYQKIVERGERHRIGEYYTPEWLVQLTLKEAISLWKEKNQGFPKILDPACGSGTFLCNTIHMVKKDLQSKKKPPNQILDFIVSNVVGIDVNPLATIVAKANYLLALGDLLQSRKEIIIPVYLADSICMPKLLITLAPEGRITVYKVDADGRPIRVPRNLTVKKAVLNQVFESFKDATDAYRDRADRKEAFEIFKKTYSMQLTPDEFDVLKSTLYTILTLIDEGLDTIWIFMLNNIYAPIALSKSKFDMVVGNPPWIAMRYVENKEYQDFVKSKVLEYELLDSNQVKLFTHMEVATLFFCRGGDLYLKDGGIIAFIQPRSILTGALQHIKFKQFRKPKMKLSRIFDLEDVSPLFNVPSCVLIASKGDETSYPVLARKYAGKLLEKNLRLSEANKHLTVRDYKYEPPTTQLKHSVYHDKVKQGATIVPRSLWAIDFDISPRLGIDMSKPVVKTSSEAQKRAKKPWKGIKLSGNIEARFIYATLLSGDLMPFGYVKLRPIVLPIEPSPTEPSPTAYRLLDVNALRRRAFGYMTEWLKKAQKFWKKYATSKSLSNCPRVISRLDYRGMLTNQNPRKKYLILYNRSGTNLVSCIVDRYFLPKFQIDKAKIRPRDFVVDSGTYYYGTDDKMEAHYLCATLNSNIIDDAIKPLQPRGLFGERDIHRRPFMFPIPRFNRNNLLHLKLAKLSKKCHTKGASVKFTMKSTARRRREARKAVEKEIGEIDKLVSRLLRL